MEPLLDIVARHGLDEEDWRQLLRARAETPTEGLAPDAAARVSFTRLNLHRTLRLERTWQPSAALAQELSLVRAPQTWLVISEPWCGDSAQCVPCLVVAARRCPVVRLRLLPRDDFPAVMDLFLTRGTRSIPILAALDDQGRELFRWGPRPAAAQAVVDTAKAEGLDKEALQERLHLFYGRDRGRALDAELLACLQAARGAAS